MQTAKNMKAYKRDIEAALSDRFLRTTLDNFAVAYRTGRKNAFAGMDVEGLIRKIAAAKDDAVGRMDELYEAFKEKAESHGVTVHLAETADAANRIIAGIARENDVKRIVKSKSMTAEETLLNHHLEAEGLMVTETDLGEWIIQLRHEGPSHMVMPAIHLSRHQVADLFTDVTGERQDPDIGRLVKVARRELRQRFVEADMGISGANFAIAETGTIGITTNEGNARLATTLPRVHVALIGLEKLTPTLAEALTINQALPRNATGQAITSYVTWITGPNECGAAPDNKKVFHIVFLDNGRRSLAKDPVFREILRCIRCGACANVCPAYRMVGGHRYGHIYIGAIGLILTYFFHGPDKAQNIVQNCINCEACKAVCAAGIDLPRIIKTVHERIQDEKGHPLSGALLAKTLRHRNLFHSLLKTARAAQKPVTGGTQYLRHLPQILFKEHQYKALPAIADRAFRDLWPEIRKPVANPRYRVALFAGCVQDFVYPEQLISAVSVLTENKVAVDFPIDQSCCGLPLMMMGEKSAAEAVALQNIAAINADRYDYILTLCASCGAHLKHAYEKLFKDQPDRIGAVRAFSEKVLPFSAFVNDVLDIDPAQFAGGGEKVTFHSPCHLCRGMGITESPRALIQKAGYELATAEEEQTCCGFGGTYSAKFPRISEEILKRKLDDFEKTGAETILTECPGCIMQLRGGAEKRGGGMKVKHIAEALAESRKPAS